jgi:hypothetical protein
MMESSEHKQHQHETNGGGGGSGMMLEMELPNGSPEEHSIPSPTGGVGDFTAKKRGVKTSHGAKGASGAPLKRKLKRSSKHSSAAEADAFIKYAALFLLVAQMVGLVLLMRLSRTLHHDSSSTPLYLASTAVFLMEVLKFLLCCMVIAYQSHGQLAREMQIHVLQSPMEMVKLCVPSLLYTVQNNLLYLALTNLDAATYQVCYQLKILTTALFSVILLQVCGYVCVYVYELSRIAFSHGSCVISLG